ncbi:MAG: c-type cytochrome [Gemmatimonadales bacterium]
MRIGEPSPCRRPAVGTTRLLRRIRPGVAAAGVTSLLAAGPVAGQQAPSNLRVLPRSISADSLITIMGGFTRALGVGCPHCHVREADSLVFSRDDLPAKSTARRMLALVALLNDSLLAALPTRADPPGRVTCATCHRGLPVPRSLQDSLTIVRRRLGVDSMLAEYRRLRERMLGDGAFDFSEVPLADLGGDLEREQAFADAERVHAFNVELFPQSAFARRQHLAAALVASYRNGVDAGSRRWAELEARYPAAIFRADALESAGRVLIELGTAPAARDLLEHAVTLRADAAGLWTALGDASLAAGDRRRAREAFTRALELDPRRPGVREKLARLGR